jgi:GTP-binding protein
MKIKTSKFVISNTNWRKGPDANLPEYAFIGRSNVGKSSLINMLLDRKELAKVSGRPGKTTLINHFIINEEWYIADLPGYGFAKVSLKQRNKFNNSTLEYLRGRENLMCVFVLIDSRLPPQKIDTDFMEYCGNKDVPFVMCFTKMDKLTSRELNKNLTHYKKEMLKTWHELPQIFITSSNSKYGQESVLKFIEATNPYFKID